MTRSFSLRSENNISAMFVRIKGGICDRVRFVACHAGNVRYAFEVMSHEFLPAFVLCC